MIIKGKSRAGPKQLAKHLTNVDKNETVKVLEVRGTVSRDLRGALIEMDACAIGTRCEKSLYHAAISPEPPHRLTPEQRAEAIDALEQKLNLSGRARVVVMHEKLGREHIHIVWARTDLEKMRAVSDSHNYRKHEEVARDLERRFGHERVQGAHAEREGVERPDRTPSAAELRQEERTGIASRTVTIEVTAAFRSADGAEAFKAGLENEGYLLAKGDRRDYVIVDRAGGIHSLARRVEGMKAAELRQFMKPLDRDSLPSVEQAKAIQVDREFGVESDYDRKKWDDALAASAIERDKAEALENERRAEEKRQSAADAQVEKAYGRGEDYVSQTRAALKDHQRRQRQQCDNQGAKPGQDETLGVDGNAPFKPRYEILEEYHREHPPSKDDGISRMGSADDDEDKAKWRDEILEEARRERRQAGEEQAERGGSSAKTRGEAHGDNIEMTDSLRARIDRVLGERGDTEGMADRDDRDPDRQREAPGGGHARSR
jgi:hypothetical protein